MYTEFVSTSTSAYDWCQWLTPSSITNEMIRIAGPILTLFFLLFQTLMNVQSQNWITVIWMQYVQIQMVAITAHVRLDIAAQDKHAHVIKLYACYLTTILLETKVLSFCHQYRARPACTYVQSDHAGSILLADHFMFSPWYP